MASVYFDFIPGDLIPGFFPQSLIPALEASAGVLAAGFVMDFFPNMGSLTMVQKERFMLSTFISTFVISTFGDTFGFSGIEESMKLMLGAGVGVLGSALLPESYHLIK